MKRIIAKRGRVQDLEFENEQKVIFKTYNNKGFLCSYGERTYEWAKEMYAMNNIAVCYKEKGIITLIVEK